MSHANRFLCKNGIVSPAADTPPVAAFLEAQPGTYTTTRTHNNVSQLLFWERHLIRISNSFKLLLRENPNLLLENPRNDSAKFWELSNRSAMWDSVIRSLVHDSMRKVMPLVVKERNLGDELAITVLLSGNWGNLDLWGGRFDEGRISEVLDVYLHVGGYIPAAFGSRESAARLAVVGRGRDFANAKYTDWVRLRKSLERLRPPSVTELLLSNDGERILEGCVTNFFVISLKEKDGGVSNAEQNELQSLSGIEVQTAPLSDGVLPGVIRQVVRDICLRNGIPFGEVSPSWSKRELWLEAFVTSSLRVIQHVETIQAPSAWESVESSSWKEIRWVEKRFQDAPGTITSMLQKEILEKASVESYPVASFEEDGPLYCALSPFLGNTAHFCALYKGGAAEAYKECIGEVRHYEVVYLIHEDHKDEVENVNTKVREFLEEKKGKVWRFSDWGMRRLAYKIKKAKNAHYILMNFEVEAQWINEFKSMLDRDERVIRHLVMKRDEAETEDCLPPPEFSTLRADMVDDDTDEEEEEEYDDEDGDDEGEDDQGIIYVNYAEEESSSSARNTPKAQKVVR